MRMDEVTSETVMMARASRRGGGLYMSQAAKFSYSRVIERAELGSKA